MIRSFSHSATAVSAICNHQSSCKSDTRITSAATACFIGPIYMVASSQPHSRSGIHALPNEILSYIFLNAIDNSDSDDLVDTAFFPLTISHICSRWRKVSIATGSLWTSIRMSLPCSCGQFAYLQAWLSRSKTYPLDMLFDFRDEGWNWESEEDHPFSRDSASQIISLILPHAKRWRHLEFFTDTWAPIHAFLDLTRNLGPSVDSFPTLKSVALSRCNAYLARKGQCFEPIALREPIRFFGGACLPSLRDLSLVGVHVDWQSRSSFANLLELEFKFHAYEVMPNLGQFTDILLGCPGLERLAIAGWGPRLDATGRVPHIISMPKLTKFYFGFVDVEYGVTFLSLFRFHLSPSLNSRILLQSWNPRVPQMPPHSLTY
ncbi:hypothetical protein BT96DRAFT_193486 [Gymnopus androsaceus JB14]|uniref:Uncharacterized protein n=1 Tax=Gymnopus androsaceus JB14 TaxID=1447944 RepID=A0A6A4H7X9_9AGAR|nr:hypothetical protein BT96DRAFT_193486 [Gymnopus androsaceus JB14]